MTPLERMRCAARRQPVDRVPVAPYLGNHGARAAGVPLGQYCRSGRVMAQAQFDAWRIYGQDAVVAQSDNYYIAEGFGVEVEHYEDATPTLKTPAVRELADIDRLRVPDPRKDGRMPVYLEAIQRLAEMTRGEVAVRAPGTGPFSLAGHLMGIENFLLELALADREPGGRGELSLKRLLNLTTDALIAFAAACLEAGAHLVQAGDSLASLDMISPAAYRKWAWPAERRFFTALNPLAERQGAATLLHICGNMTPVLESMADTGAAYPGIGSQGQPQSGQGTRRQPGLPDGQSRPGGIVMAGHSRGRGAGRATGHCGRRPAGRFHSGFRLRGARRRPEGKRDGPHPGGCLHRAENQFDVKTPAGQLEEAGAGCRTLLHRWIRIRRPTDEDSPSPRGRGPG